MMLSDVWRLSDVCLSAWRMSVAYMMNIHGAHSHWKQGALGAAGVRRVWAGAGPQRAAYRGGGISCGLAHSLFALMQWRKQITSRLTAELTGMKNPIKSTLHWVMYHTVHCDKQKKNKNIKTDHAEHNVKRLRTLLYNSRLNEERQLHSSSHAGKVFQQWMTLREKKFLHTSIRDWEMYNL